MHRKSLLEKQTFRSWLSGELFDLEVAVADRYLLMHRKSLLEKQTLCSWLSGELFDLEVAVADRYLKKSHSWCIFHECYAS